MQFIVPAFQPEPLDSNCPGVDILVFWIALDIKVCVIFGGGDVILVIRFLFDIFLLPVKF